MIKNQYELFKYVWETEPHFSMIDGSFLGDEANAMFFAHILPKSHYGLWKLNPKNIVLMTPEQHDLYDHKTHMARQDPQFHFLFEWADHLKVQYYRDWNEMKMQKSLTSHEKAKERLRKNSGR